MTNAYQFNKVPIKKENGIIYISTAFEKWHNKPSRKTLFRTVMNPKTQKPKTEWLVIANQKEFEDKISLLPDGRHNVSITIIDNENLFEDVGAWAIRIENIDFIRFGGKVFYNLFDLYNRFLIEELRAHKNELEGINYQDTKDPDWNPAEVYTSDLKRLFYVYRMCYMYSSVYFNMFKVGLEKIAIDPGSKYNFHVLSIGCGCKSDEFALKYALQKPDVKNLTNDLKYKPKINTGKFKYIGIDAADWTSTIFEINPDDEYFVLSNDANADDYVTQECRIIDELKPAIDEFDMQSGNNIFMIVLPNMISELDPERVSRIMETIIEVYHGKKVYILASRNPLSNSGESLSLKELNTVRDYVKKCGGTLIATEKTLKRNGLAIIPGTYEEACCGSALVKDTVVYEGRKKVEIPKKRHGEIQRFNYDLEETDHDEDERVVALLDLEKYCLFDVYQLFKGDDT